MHLGNCFPLPLWLLDKIWDSFLGLFLLFFLALGPSRPRAQHHLPKATSLLPQPHPGAGAIPRHCVTAADPSITSRSCLAPNQLLWLGADPGCRRGCCGPIPAVRSLWGRAVAPGPACSPGGTGPCELLTCPSFIPAWHRHECWALPGPFVSRAQHPAACRDVPTAGTSPCQLHPLVNQHHRGIRRCWAHTEPETLRAVTPQCPGTPLPGWVSSVVLRNLPPGELFQQPQSRDTAGLWCPEPGGEGAGTEHQEPSGAPSKWGWFGVAVTSPPSAAPPELAPLSG